MSSRQKQVALCISELSMHVRKDNASGITEYLDLIKSDKVLRQDFIKHDGLPIVVELLRSQNPTILNICLSVLADACTLPKARYELRDSKLKEYIISILKDLRLSSTIHCRACRLVSNLSECSWHAESLYNAGVVEPLAALLRINTVKQTYIMAVRALRNIWNIHEGSRQKILDIEAVRLVSQIFVMAQEKSDVDAKYADLVDKCLKAMSVFLVPLNDRCSKQMEVDKNNTGYLCLVRCCNSGNKLAINCLYNLCQIGTYCRVELGRCGAVEQLIGLIKSSSMVDSNLSNELLTSLYMFCLESVNRAKISNGGGLQLIVMLLKKPNLKKYHLMLLDSLRQFSSCDTSMVILSKHGVIEVLIEKLMDSIEKENDLGFNISNNSSKRKIDSDYSPCRKFARTSEKRSCIYTSYYFDGDSSPGSEFASTSSSPPSTPPGLLSYYSMTENDDMDDDYSPVYDDTEWADDDMETIGTMQSEEDSLKSYKSLAIDADNSHNTENTSKNIFCDQIALMLLWRLCVNMEPIEKLADPTTIKPLLNYIRHTKNETAIKILIKIVRNVVYFMPLLTQGFVFDVQDLHNVELFIQELWVVAETGGAVGQLSSMLRRGEEKLKLIAAVSIPFILKSRITLRSLLHQYGGLQLIFRLLTESSHELHERAIWSICRLAFTLQIYPEAVGECLEITTDNVSSPLYDCPRSYENYSRPLSKVTFILDDGRTVDACRHTLCQRSDAFSAMLEGNFYESGKRYVKLRDASHSGLSTLISAASGAEYKHHDIESLLDAVLLADKFLMPDLLDELTNSSVSKLCYRNFSRAWCWARTNGCHELKFYCIKSFLTATMTKSETVKAFRDFFATKAFDEFLCDVREVIIDALCQL